MFINLKMLDAETGSFFETEAVLIGDGCAVYNDGGSLSMISVKEEDYEMNMEKMSELFEKDPSIIDRMIEMAAQDYLELFE